MPKYKAVFNFSGWEKEIEMEGTPAIDTGFALVGDASVEDAHNVSLYFRLISFDGEVATYHFYGARVL